jgi:hypothetical protein
MTVPTTSATTPIEMSGYCAESGAMKVPARGANAAMVATSQGSLRYQGRDASSATAGCASDSGARLGSSRGSPSVG